MWHPLISGTRPWICSAASEAHARSEVWINTSERDVQGSLRDLDTESSRFGHRDSVKLCQPPTFMCLWSPCSVRGSGPAAPRTVLVSVGSREQEPSSELRAAAQRAEKPQQVLQHRLVSLLPSLVHGQRARSRWEPSQNPSGGQQGGKLPRGRASLFSSNLTLLTANSPASLHPLVGTSSGLTSAGFHLDLISTTRGCAQRCLTATAAGLGAQQQLPHPHIPASHVLHPSSCTPPTPHSCLPAPHIPPGDRSR